MAEGQHPKCFLAGLLFALALGICAARAFSPAPLPLTPLLGILFLLSAFLAWRSSRWAFLSFLLLFFVLGIVRFSMSFPLPAHDISHLAGEKAEIRGILREVPQERVDARGETQTRYRVEVMEVRRGHAWQAASGGVQIYARGEAQEARIGDVVTASGEVRLPHSYQNRGQVDTALLLRADGVTASLLAGKARVAFEAREADGIGWGDALLRVGAQLRAHYRRAMETALSDHDAAAIFAMLFGGYDGVREELVDSFTATGLIHILSVSGSHVSLLAGTLAYIGLLLRLPRPVTVLLVLFAILSYTVLAGCVPPAVRAGVMGTLAFLAVAAGREHEGQHILLLTGLLMLLVSPLLLFHISFQLSFAATAGLLYLAPVFRAWLGARGAAPFVAAGLSITLAAQLATLPLLAWYFGRVSLVALFANLLLVPPVEVIIVAALFGGAAALALPLVGQVLFALLGLVLGGVYEMAQALAKVPMGMVGVPAMGAGETLFYYLALGMLLLPKEVRGRARRFVWCHRREAGAFLAALLLVVAARHALAPKAMEVHFLDVHQGDACLVRTPNGHAFMIDTGGTRDGAYDIGARVDVPYLRRCGVAALDALFLSHAHEDHAAGAGSILGTLPVYHVFTASEGREAYARSMGLSVASPLLDSLTPLHAGERFAIDGVTVEVLAAPNDAQAGGSGNEACNVLRVSYGGTSILFTGDMGMEEEQALLGAGIDPASTVLKVAHHGSPTSTGEPFLRAVSPRLAVLSVGADNVYGHPAPAVLARLKEAGIPLLRTDEQGAVVLWTDGKRLTGKPYAGNEVSLNVP